MTILTRPYMRFTPTITTKYRTKMNARNMKMMLMMLIENIAGLASTILERADYTSCLVPTLPQWLFSILSSPRPRQKSNNTKYITSPLKASSLLHLHIDSHPSCPITLLNKNVQEKSGYYTLKDRAQIYIIVTNYN